MNNLIKKRNREGYMRYISFSDISKSNTELVDLIKKVDPIKTVVHKIKLIVDKDCEILINRIDKVLIKSDCGLIIDLEDPNVFSFIIINEGIKFHVDLGYGGE